jgi:hypothetical protein
MLSLRRPLTAFQKPFPEFWNALGQHDRAFRPQPPSCLAIARQSSPLRRRAVIASLSRSSEAAQAASP